ncbi:membrane protein [Streptomyces albiaxialis]|uniref:Membrane protein n=1 Tax=Streptomyces albiaxialis TaxID=329523 RepID=A0ABP5ICR4_9ACTN
MSRWALPWRGGGRQFVRTGADGMLDVLYPVLVLVRGAGRLATLAKTRWKRTPKERRGPALFLVVACGLVLWLMPYGPLIAVASFVAAAAWYGRERAGEIVEEDEGPGEDELARLQALYEALVPYFAMPDDPHAEPMYAHDGEWGRAFEEFEFSPEGRLSALRLRYPAHFRDGEPEERLRVEQLLAAKSGRGREYRFAWDEERNRLEMTVLAPLLTGIHAQRFVTAPGETVLGFTDGGAVRRTVPVAVAGMDGAVDVPPVVWRTGARSTEPHLLAMGVPGSGTSTLLRSVALQALRRGEVLVVDGDGGGEFACLAARRGVLGVESSLAGALASFEWVVRETERRLLAASRARQVGEQVPEDARSPLWVLVDRPAVLTHLARAEGQRDPQELLQVPLRHGRAAGVSVVVAEQFEGAEDLGQAVRAYTRARVVLGPVTRDQARAVLGEAPQSGPAADTPPGRGFARLGTGPVLRLQVPATPDPYDEAAGEAEREAVRALLPDRPGLDDPDPEAPLPTA